MKWCISTASFSVVVNDTPTSFFQSSRGLRQRDPLSPYLFVVAMEALSCFIKKTVSGGFLKGCQARGKGGEGVMTYLSRLLMWFEAIYGLKINLEKSELIPVGEVNDNEELALDMGAKLGRLVSSYPGLPLDPLFKPVPV